MLKANTGSSVAGNPGIAGAEAAAKAKAGLDGVKLAYVYASCDYDLDALLKGVSGELPGVPLIGNTTFTGVITPEGYIGGENGFVGMMAISDPELTVGVAAVRRSGDAAAAGAEAARLAMKKAGKTMPPDYYYMVSPPGLEEFYVKGITQVIGRVPFYGGSAADNTLEGKWKLYTDGGVLDDGVAFAFFYTKKKMTNKFTGAYRETRDIGVITKVVDNRVLSEIDGIPALEKYASWRGMDIETLKGGALLAESVTSPLGVKDRLGDLVAIRHPMNGNDDMTMSIGNQLAEGTAVIRMEGSVDELIAATGHTLDALKEKMPAPAGAFHFVHCGGRRLRIDGRIDEVAAQLKKEAGDVPFIAEFTFGEYGCEADGTNTCGGLMLSFTAFEA